MEDQTDLNEPVGQARRQRSWASVALAFLGILAVLLGMGFLTAALTGTAQQVAFGATALFAFFGFLTVVGMVGSRHSQEPLLSSHREWGEFLSNAPLEDIPEFRAAAKEFVIRDNISLDHWLHNFVFLTDPTSAAMVLVKGNPVTPSPSAAKMASAGSRPPFPIWFLAAYPDVAVWPNEQIRAAVAGDGTALRALDQWTERLPNQSHTSEIGSLEKLEDIETLRSLVDAYRDVTRRKLECAT